MKKVLNAPFWKSLFVIGLFISMVLLFCFIDHQTTKTLIGVSGFILMLFSVAKNKKSII